VAHRVIQWGTGNVGIRSLRAIIGHPDLELVGLWVHSDNKVGVDAGELCGLPPVGVAATNDADALLALDADCVAYMATADLRPGEAVEDLSRILASGKNVVSTSVVPLIHPKTGEKAWVDTLEKACAEGGTSCWTSGIDPGFGNDLIPIALLSACQEVRSVRVMEILNYDTYDQATVLFETMGFGQALDATPLLLFPGALTLAWGGVVGEIAEALGVEVDEIKEVSERQPAPERFSIPAGTVEKGTTAALRFEVQGIIDGRPAIVVEHVTRLRDDLAPEWPQPVAGGCYRILIDGYPSIQADVQLAGADGDHNDAGLVATAARVLNGIPAVVDAPPGLLSALDIPVAACRGVLR
jgi:4-hydroxy-tetrahydrodipicolinate reductase